LAADPTHVLTARRLTPEAAGAYVGKLFEQHGRMVYGLCRLLLRDGVEAEDAAQQTFLSAHASILNGTVPREPAPWLAAIARNECRGRIRARMSQPLTVVSDGEQPTADLEEVAGSRAELRALCEAMTELPPHQRDAIVLREFYGLSYDEVGAALGVSTSAVDSLLVRARKRLEHELRPARAASAALIVPIALRESLVHALPGFTSSGAATGLVAKAASMPLAAKLCAGALTLVATGSVAITGAPHGGSRGIAEHALRAVGAESAHAAEPAPRRAAASLGPEAVATLTGDSEPRPQGADDEKEQDDLGDGRSNDDDERDDDLRHENEGPDDGDGEDEGQSGHDGPSEEDGEGGSSGDDEESGPDEPEPTEDDEGDGSSEED
jgi:RNA polymerase sigma-70 factor, ECF subfamily